MSLADATGPATISHRYPWSGEELAIITTFALGPSAITVALWASAPRPWVLPLVLHAIGLSVAAGLFVLGRRRKNASRVTATLTGSRLAVRGGRVKASTGDLATAVSASTTRMGPETVLVVELRDGAVMVPGRILRDPALAAVIDRHLVHGGTRLSHGARELLDL